LSRTLRNLAAAILLIAFASWSALAVDQPGKLAAPAVNKAVDEGPAAADPARQGIAGHWQGTLEAGVKLRVVFNIEQAADGKLTATLDSLDQGAKGIAIDEITLENNTLRLTAKGIDGSFEGQRNAAGNEISGSWKQLGRSLPLVLKPVDKPLPLNRPQEPKKPYPYDEQEVTYENNSGENKAAGVKLAGTLTLPRAVDSRVKAPYAAVLLITGSGPQNRDEELLGHKPFLVLADYLTRRGIAVLRVDDRGVGGSTGKLNEATTADLAGDALAGVEFLKSRKDIDPRRIGLIGHSEGGLIAPLVAARSGDVAFIVLIAGPGTTGEQILYAQGSLILKAAGASDDKIARQRQLQERLFAAVKQTDRAEADTQLAEIFAAELDRLSEAERKAVGNASALADVQRKQLLTPWFRYFLTYDPRPTLAKVKCPVLAVIGERDLQVPPKENLPEIEKALKRGGNQEFTVRELPGLNHLLQTCKTGSPTEYGQIEQTMAPSALELIGDWIVKRTQR
jgi:uncharacterized protein